MNVLDIRTIIFSYVVSNAVCMAVMASLWLRNRHRFAGLGFWLADFAMQFAAILLVALRGQVPDFLSIVVSNGLVIAGTILLLMGLEGFIGKRSSHVGNFILLGGFIFIHGYFTFIQPSLLIRTINLSIGIILMCAQCAWLLIYRANAEMRPITRGVGYIFLVFCLSSLARILVDLVVSPGNDFFHSDVFEAIATLTNQILFVILTFGLILMVNLRLVLELEHDITKQKKAEEGLRRFELLSEHSRDIILLMSREDGRILEANSAAVQAYGYSHDELLELTIRDLRSGGTEALAAEQMAQADAGGILFETIHQRKDGSTFPVEVSSQGATINGVRTLISIVRDITERKRAEEEITNLSRFPTENPYPVLRVGNDGRVIYANATSRELLEMWGCEIGGILPAQLKDLITVTADNSSNTTLDIPCKNKVYSVTLVPIPGGGYVNLYGSDVTARVQAEELLREKEARLRQALDAAKAGIWEWDVQTDKNIWSEELWRLYGLEPNSSEPTYHTWLATVHPDDRVPTAQTIQEAATNGKELNVEWRVVDQDGTQRWLMSRGQPIRDSAGKTVRFIGTVLDITERKLAEQKVQRSEATLRSVLEHMPSGVTVREAHSGEVVLSNSRSREILNNLAATPAHFARYRGFHPDGRPYRNEEWPLSRSIATGEVVHAEEINLRRGDDTRITLSINSAPIRDPQGWIIMAVGVFDDVTERKRMEDELRANEERYRAMFDHALDAILVTDPSGEGRVVSANPAACRLFGYSLEEFQALDRAAILDMSDPNLAGMLEQRAHHRKAVAELTYKRKDGTRFSGELSAALYQDQNGESRSLSIIRDITERKQAEEALTESEERLRLSLHAANQGLYDLNVQTGAAIVNEEYAQMLGYDPATFVETNAAWIERLHPDDKAITSKAYADYIAGLLPEYRVEFRQKTRDGNWKWILSLGKVVEYDSLGMPLRMLGTHTDITERKQAEERQVQLTEALEQHLAELQTLMDVAPVGIAIGHDAEGRVITVNKLLSDWLSAPAGSNVSLSVPEEERQVSYQVLRKGQPVPVEELPVQYAALNACGVRNDEFTIVHSDGRIIEMLANADPLFDNTGQVRGAIAAYHDITDRKQAEETLRRKEAEIRSLYVTMTELFVLHEVIYDTSGKAIDYRILECNPAFERITGIRQEAAIGKLASKVYGTGEAPYLDIYAAVAEDGDPIEFETEFAPMGKQFRISVFSPERGRFATLASDITERKRAEMELQQTLEELKHSNAELEEFAYVASHDLQEPLRGIAGLVQLLQRRYQGQLDSRADEYIAHIVEATQRMQRLIEDLLAYSRVGRRGNLFQAAEADAALKAALKNLSAAISDAGVEITGGRLPTVKADATQVTQLFQNLIGNAIKFRSTRLPQIHVEAADAGDFWQFSVRDNGIGIEPQYFERIFQVFQRLHTQREYKGTGIGLAICKKIIERHGGRIWVESEMGQGSTFYFTLPKG